MKKRVLVPIKILAFALSTGCTAPEPVKAAQSEPPAPIASTPPALPPVATVDPRERQDLPIDIGNPMINTLRAELARDKNALGHADRYRPLCDKDGYPLVGNLNRKGHIEFEPSQICRAIREEASKR
jgi:hypothetical protein